MDYSVFKNFKDIAIDESHGWSIGYRSGNAVFEEGIRNGQLVSLSYNASGYLMSTNPLPTPTWMDIENGDFMFATRPESFSLAVDGQSLNSHWEFVSFDKEEADGKITARIHLRHTVRPVEVTVCTEVDGTPIFRRWIEVVNTGDRPAAVNELAPLSGAWQIVYNSDSYMKEGEALYKLGYIKSHRYANEGEFGWIDLPEEIFTVAGRYRRDRHRHPMFALKNQATGEIFICQMEWSGGYAFEFDNKQCGDLNTPRQHNGLSVRVLMDSPQPIYVLEPGETFVSPKVDVGVLFGDLDDAVNAMNEHVRRSVLVRPDDAEFDLIESGIGPEFVMSRENTLRSIDDAANIGAEVFFIDAGWYMPPNEEDNWWTKCGDWTYDPKRYPNGIEEIREYLHSKGMKFGMWMDVERIHAESNTSKEHPDWIAKLYTEKKNSSGLLDLTKPEVAKWMQEQIVHLIEDYKIDMFRLDWNVATLNMRYYSRNGDYLESAYARHCEAVYNVYSEIRRKYPHIILENCAGGGGRTDLGMVANFNHTWVTDWQHAPRSFGITNGMTLCLPPECVDRLMIGQGGYLTGDIPFQINNLMFTHMTIGNGFPENQTVHIGQLDYIRHCVELYKSFVRPMIRDCKIYHHTPELEFPSPRGYGIIEMASQDNSRGMLGIFRLSGPDNNEKIIKLRGVEISKKYKVTFEGSGESTVIDGFRLKNEGLCVRLEGALTSELVTYREI